MTGLAALALWVLSWAPNGGSLALAFEAADVLEHRLVPWREILDSARPLWIVRRSGPVPAALRGAPIPPAFFLGPEGVRGREGWVADRLLASGSQDAFAGLRVPRLVLAASHYGESSTAELELEALPVDTSQNLLRVLLEARWARLDSDPEKVQEVERRAAQTFARTPAEHRRQAFLTASTDFLSHLYSVAHEIGRHQRRRVARGEDLCAALGHPSTLFGSWKRAFLSGDYRGYEPRQRAGSGGRVDWVWTRDALSADDKRWLLAELGRHDSGDPEVDFRDLCPRS